MSSMNVGINAANTRINTAKPSLLMSECDQIPHTTHGKMTTRLASTAPRFEITRNGETSLILTRGGASADGSHCAASA